MEEEDVGVWGTRVDVSVQGSGALDQGPSLRHNRFRKNWLGWVLACPIMAWITPLHRRSYPPFCGAKPSCVREWGRMGGGHSGTCWRGEFSSPYAQSADTDTNSPTILTHTHITTRTPLKVPAQGYEHNRQKASKHRGEPGLQHGSGETFLVKAFINSPDPRTVASSLGPPLKSCRPSWRWQDLPRSMCYRQQPAWCSRGASWLLPHSIAAAS